MNKDNINLSPATINHVRIFKVQCPYNFVQLYASSELQDIFSYKFPILNLAEILPVGAAPIHADRRTDMTNVNTRFARFI
jgi:hypothetical protein